MLYLTAPLNTLENIVVAREIVRNEKKKKKLPKRLFPSLNISDFNSTLITPFYNDIFKANPF